MRLARGCAGIALAAVAFEILLRWLGFGGAAVEARHRHFPSEGVTIRNRTGEGWASSRWDARGVRIVPGSEARGAPLLVLGDSFTQALQVDDGEVYTALLQKELGRPVLNRGCAACSPADYVVHAASLVGRDRPAWTVIQMNPPDLYGDAFARDKTHFEYREGRLAAVEVTPNPSDPPLLAGARRASALADYAVVRAGMFRRASKMPPLFNASQAGRIPPNSSGRIPPVPHVEDVLDAMNAAHGGRVTFFFVPEYVEDLTSSFPLIDERPRDVERRFERWCAVTGTSCVNLRASFPDFARSGRAPTGFPNSRFGRGHLNGDGHDAAARLIARELDHLRRRGLF